MCVACVAEDESLDYFTNRLCDGVTGPEFFRHMSQPAVGDAVANDDAMPKYRQWRGPGLDDPLSDVGGGAQETSEVADLRRRVEALEGALLDMRWEVHTMHEALQRTAAQVANISGS